MSNILQQTTTINVTIINNAAIEVNGKCVIRTKSGGWVRQAGDFNDDEIQAMQLVIKSIDRKTKSNG